MVAAGRSIELLVEAKYLESLYIRRLGDPSPTAVGPSSQGQGLPYVTPSTILGALATALMELKVLDEGQIERARGDSQHRYIKAFTVLSKTLGLSVTGPPYVLLRALGGGIEKIYIFTRQGPIGIDEISSKLSEYSEYILKSPPTSDTDRLRSAMAKLLNGLSGLSSVWAHQVIRVSLQDPEKTAKEGYLFSRVHLALGRASGGIAGDLYICLPIGMNIYIKELESPTIVRLGGGSRVASISLRRLGDKDPLKKKVEGMIRSSKPSPYQLLILASPFPAPDNMGRSDIAEYFRKIVSRIIGDKCSTDSDKAIAASRIYIDQQPEGWDLRENARRPYRVWIAPGSLMVVNACRDLVSELFNKLYLGEYAKDIKEEHLEEVRELIDEGYGRFIVVPIPQKGNSAEGGTL